ncbi:polyadenylate-binding protein-interacting protein 7 [Phalaenopsis equestris]|uniref:polyadenylate-binding protein-interacting protein 7 n=1 Tax=Phalaenopsis equestris TaxID=78828 RepID=UPI0009E632E4|nr:polyadenylate-binding protein-interacting protein 7 [Phalaenopsis equestris]
MSLPAKGLNNKKEAKWSIPNKSTTLNPNAAEFVPFSLKSAGESNQVDNTYRLDLPGSSRKGFLDRSDSTTSHNSDDEAHQYWRHHLPDDITPDFTATGKDDFPGPELLPIAGLSIFDENDGSSVPELVSRHAQITRGMTDELRYSDSMFHQDQSSVAFTAPAKDSWDNELIKATQHLSNGLDGYHLNGSSSAGLVNNSYIDHLIMEDSAINHVEFLALQFPGFSAGSLAEVYYANNCDLNLTIEILTQLELQMDGGFTQNQNLKAIATPNLNSLDFPALPVTDSRNRFATGSRENIQDLYRSSSSLFRGPPDFASAVRKLASQDNGTWKHERNGSVDSFGSSGVNRQMVTNSYKGNVKLAYENKLQGLGAAQASPIWLETGEAVANIYSTSREDARDFARLRNACFQQARDAYLIGNKALAKELGDKGKWYNLQMKEAHAKARETIYRQRNPVSSEAYSRGQERMIDLHGLHMSEAIHVLKHELANLRNAARLSGHRLQVLICVGTGHHTKGTRTPARLPIAVEQYLAEEGIHYTQPQPGLLRVVIY